MQRSKGNFRKRILAAMLSGIMLLSFNGLSVLAATPEEVMAEEEEKSNEDELKTVSLDLEEKTLQLGAFPEGEESVLDPQTEEEKEKLEGAYEAIHDGIERREEKIDLSAYELTPEEVEELTAAVLNEEPGFFYVEGAAVAYEEASGITSVETILYGVKTDEELAEYEAAVAKALSGVKEGWTDFQKIIYVHDYLVKHCRFDHGNREPRIRSAYGAMVNRLAVCVGYSYAFTDLMRRLNIEAANAGSSDMGHEWNIVKLDGEWFYVDCTFDDPDYHTTDYYDAHVSHEHLLLSREGMVERGYDSTDWDTKWGDWKRDREIMYDTPTGNKYDSAPWRNADHSAFAMLENDFLYIDSKTDTLCRSTGLDSTTLLDLKEATKNREGHYHTTYCGLAVANGKVYLNDPDHVYRYSDGELIEISAITEEEKKVHYLWDDPNFKVDSAIYGISATDDGNLLCSLGETPRLAEVTGEKRIDLKVCDPDEKDWKDIIYTVRFDGSGAEGSMQGLSCIYGESYALPANAFSKTGSTFLGWNTKPDGSGKTYADQAQIKNLSTVNGTVVTLYAMWKGEPCTVSFDMKGGSEVSPWNGFAGETVSAPENPTKEGYEFAGWYADPECTTPFDFTAPVIESTTVYAGWKLILSSPVPNIADGSRDLKEEAELTLSSSDGAEIYYTTDGTDPVSSETRLLYQSPIRLAGIMAEDRSVSVKAVAEKAGCVSSSVIALTYTMGEEDWGDVSEKARAQFASAKDIDAGIWTYGITDMDYTGKTITFPELEVYHHKTLLVSGTDYTVKYGKNTMPGKNAGSVTIIGKGDYAGQLPETFTINPLSLGETQDGTVKNSENLTAPDITLPYTGRQQNGTTEVYYLVGSVNTLLKAGKDFDYVYPAGTGACTKAGDWTVTLQGKGGFTGEATFTETITDSITQISKAKLSGFQSKLPYAENGVRQSVTLSVNGAGTLKENTDYRITYAGNTSPGKASMIITGIGNYCGKIKKDFQITGIPFNTKNIKGTIRISNAVYDGRPITKERKPDLFTIDLTDLNENKLEEGKDYTLSYTNNILPGSKAQLILTGKGKYTGKLIQKFGIQQINLFDGDREYVKDEGFLDKLPDDVTLKINGAEEKYYNASLTFNVDPIPYEKDGTVPEVEINWRGRKLIEGKDYALSVRGNKEAGGYAILTIKAKGMFYTERRVAYTIAPSSLANTTILASDIKWANKAGICKPSITVLDSNGKALKAKTDYTVQSYTYKADTAVSLKTGGKAERKAGEQVGAADIVPEGTVILASLKGIGNYAEEKEYTAEFRYVKNLLSGVKAQIPEQELTGSPIEITKDDITKLTLKNNPLSASDYEIVPGTFINNVKPGTAKVTIRGKGNYGGMAVVSFKIGKRRIG